MVGVVYLLSGLIFALGLAVSGMIQPDKVRAFLAFGLPQWNPALAFVMASAIPVYALAYFFVSKRRTTLRRHAFTEPVVRPISLSLVTGAVLFGIGWGLVGLCPGPALARIAWFNGELGIFLVTMFLGFEVSKGILKS